MMQVDEMMSHWRDQMLSSGILTEAQVNALKAQPKMQSEAIAFVKKNLEKLQENKIKLEIKLGIQKKDNEDLQVHTQY